MAHYIDGYVVAVPKSKRADPRLADMMDPKTLPFDGKRMFWGGFKTIVEQ